MRFAGLPSNEVEILKKVVGGHIRDLRRKHGYKTVELFAEALKVHPNSVGELERGANWISPEMLEKMVSLLNLPPAAFFPGVERMNRPTPQEALDILRQAIEAPSPAADLSARERAVLGALRRLKEYDITFALELLETLAAEPGNLANVILRRVQGINLPDEQRKQKR